MDLNIQPLRPSDTLRQTLSQDGWRLEAQANGSWRASHPLVKDEPAARTRLHHLGLLTSPSLRIEFHPPEVKRGPRSQRFQD